ncbi:MAG: T9SS C-terminal target domain-containing protein, partial [Balneolaceae bacterium]
QSFSLSGANLDGSDVSITAPDDFEVSLDNSSFAGSVNLTAFDGSSTDIWVRLEEALSVGTYSGDVTIEGGDAEEISVSVSGDVTEPPVTDLPFTTIFNTAENWEADGTMTGYNEKTYIEGGWFFNSTEAVRGGAGESFGGSNYSFRDRGVFTVYNLASVNGMTGFRFQLYDWMAGDGVDRDLQISLDGADTWETVLVINKSWFNEFQVYQPFVYYFEEAQDFAAEEFQIQILNPNPNNNASRMNIGLFEALDTPEPASVEIAGNAGWRMLSVPVEGATVADLAAQNQVQGIAGAADLYGTEAPDGIESDPPNIFTSYEAGWSTPDNVSDELEIGKGLIWYLFNNDEGVSTALPFTLTATGASPASDVTTSLHTSTEQLDDGDGGTAQVAFNLLGNPFAADLDITEIADWVDGGSLNSSIVQVWKNDEAGWQEGLGHQGEWVLIGGGNNDDKVAAWQGFMVENLNATSIEYPASARTDGGTLLKEQQPVQKRLVFTLEGENTEAGLRTRDAANLVFDDQAEKGWDLLDATQLTPLAGSYATLSFVGDVNGQQVLKVQESRPAEFEGRFEIPMAFEAYNMGGDFTISWDGLADLPSEWQLTLTDLHTGQSMNLREADEYTFRYENGNQTRPAKSVGAGAVVSGVKPLVLSADDEQDGGARFRLIVDSEPVSSEIPGDVPQELELSQNYPNPFNPSTVIRYTVPEQAHIRLTVYDMLGREISVLVNEQQGPGSYDVTWDGTDFTSGLYLYRLEAGSKSITRRMTFIK